MNWRGKNHKPEQPEPREVSDDMCPACNAQRIVFHCLQQKSARELMAFPAGTKRDKYAVLGISLGVVDIFVERDGHRAITVEAFGAPVMMITEDAVEFDEEDEGFWQDVLATTRMALDAQFGPVDLPDSHVH
jgi:hypothetical protein